MLPNPGMKLESLRRGWVLPNCRVASTSWMLVLLCCLLGLSQPGHSAERPLKVFVLVGQSNMQGHAEVRTFDHIGMDPATEGLLADMRNGDKPVSCEDVWVSYLSSNGVRSGQLTVGYGANENKIGPEFTFGIYLNKLLAEPFLIIKAAWGGKSLHTDFRPPSAGAYPFSEQQLNQLTRQGKDVPTIREQKRLATGQYYRSMLEHVRQTLDKIDQLHPNYDANAGYELSGIVWFQGWNDMVDRGVYPERNEPGGYDAYSEVLAHFIRDIRRDLDVPKLPFVIGVLGVGGPVSLYRPEQMRYRDIHQNFRDAMAAPAAMPEFKGNVAAVLTEQFWDQELVTLRAKENAVRQTVRRLQKERELKAAEVKATREKLLVEALTAGEREILKTGVSNQEYHYLGSAKIIGQIGEAFAETMAELMGE